MVITIGSSGVNWAEWLGAFATVAAVLVALFLPVAQHLLLRPKLRIEFQAEEPFLRNTLLADGRTAAWLRVRVRNVGRRAAAGCVGKVVAVSSSTGTRTDIDPLQLRWSSMEESRRLTPVRIAPRDALFLDVLMVHQDNKLAMEFVNADQSAPGHETTLLSGETHRIELGVFGDTADTHRGLAVHYDSDANQFEASLL